MQKGAHSKPFLHWRDELFTDSSDQIVRLLGKASLDIVTVAEYPVEEDRTECLHRDMDNWAAKKLSPNVV